MESTETKYYSFDSEEEAHANDLQSMGYSVCLTLGSIFAVMLGIGLFLLL